MSLDRSHTLTALGILMTGLFLTGCNPEGDAVAGSPTTSSASAAKGEGATVGNRKDGTVTGTLTYLAPGKLEVDGRPFYIGEQSKIWGTGEICGDPADHKTVECTVEQAELAAKSGTARAEVVIEKGIATKITDQYNFGNPSEVDEGHVSGADGGSDTPTSPPGGDEAGSSAGTSGNSGTGGATADNRKDGTVTGTLTYLAPGKIEVDGRPFYVAEDTKILGRGGICGPKGATSATSCTDLQLEAAAKTGKVTASVTIQRGIGTKVVEQ
ncbi:hypothetical protein ACFYWY_13150 [Streptomyces sp. NPDC002870]|uniref:hypothetical protein n=1 Tax=Streptomyces sp. NPDC002870 TaxID=3364666 RepID=UPI0036C843A1